MDRERERERERERGGLKDSCVRKEGTLKKGIKRLLAKHLTRDHPLVLLMSL